MGLLAIAWQEYYPRSAMLDVVGIRGPRASSGRECDGIYSHRKFWQLPRRSLMCRGPSYFSRQSMYSEEVWVDGLSRKLLSAQKAWTVPDSAAWARGRDSATRALAAKGGHPFQCKYQPTLPAPGSLSYWKVRGFYVRLAAYPSQPGESPHWIFQESGETMIPYECIHPPPDRDASGGCTGADVVRIPLPRGWVICWRSSLWD